MNDPHNSSDDATVSWLKANLAAIVESSDDAIIGKTLDGTISSWNRSAENMFGYSVDEAVGQSITLIIPMDRQHEEALILGKMRAGERMEHYETVRRHKNGTLLDISLTASPIKNETGQVIGVSKIARDITEKKRAEVHLRELNETLERGMAEALAERKILADIVESTDVLIQVVSPDFRWMAINRASADAFERIFGVRPKAGDSVLDLLENRPEHRASVEANWSRALAGEAFTTVEDFGDPPHDRRFYEMKFNPLHDVTGKIIGAYQFVYDVTRRMQDQARLEEAEVQLRQAQKMDAVGQLTGGIAHDFNNMLAVIMGSLELLKKRISAEDVRAKRHVDTAVDSTKRAAMLTQRLLAFSRQQPLRPETVDINKLVSGMSELLLHALGGQIRLETVLSGGLWHTHVDPNQLENVILNLGVNARDAMPDGGRLTIETQNASLDAKYVSRNPGTTVGHYVMIALTDTGTGMTPDIMAKAFDPFFTTKEVGKGTGLGLSQVYGFVKQSGGHVKIYSETGQGTSVKIYLPRTTDMNAAVESDVETPLPMGDDLELILVVDDEEAVRQISVDALSELGYRVMEADGAAAALRILAANPDIDLLFTDIAMPDTNGRKLADQAILLRPGLKVLYTTGYTRNAVVHNGVVDPGVELIGKPFTLDDLAEKVREILDRP